MKKNLIMILVLLGISLFSITGSYANIFNDNSFVSLNEVDSFTNVVIFIKFNDEASYVAPYDYDYYENMFNGEDVVSLRDYYLEASYNKLTIDSYLINNASEIVYYVDSHDRSYYEPYDSSTNPNGYTEGEQSDREHVLLKDAIDYVDDNNLIDDSIVLDSNDDGDIDSITFMVSGEDNGWNTMFWPHKWDLFTYYNYNSEEYTYDAPMINGVYAYDYTFELMGNSRFYDEIVYTGVLAHETFHLISATDLYHYYDSQNIDPIGDWGIMGSTSFVPSHMLGYMKEYYGKWIDNVSEITESGSYTLGPLQESEDNLYKINLDSSNEYIYLEYRDNEGLYESNLLDSGLLVYRVDMDYLNIGNDYGYYDDNDLGEDEVFVFRPGIPDSTPPITFPIDDDFNIDEDGNIDAAALSDNNFYDEMGTGTNIPMFYSSGELIDITISNVVEHDGYVTFDVELPLRIELDMDEELPGGSTLFLVDDSIYEYNFSILNLPLVGDTYYTTNGSLPTTSDTLYVGGLIPFTATNNEITVAVYEGEVLIETISKEFNFVSSVETDHNPYGNLLNISWYLDFKHEINDYTLSFHNSSELEDDYDYVYIINNGTTLTYTGIDMRDVELNYSNENLLVNFVSDTYLDEYYGVGIDVVVNNTVDIHVNGDEYIELNIGDSFVDEGAYLSGDNLELFSILIEGDIDTDNPGIQVITYNILNQDENIIESIDREINIIDVTAPVVTLVGEDEITLNYLDSYSELGVTYTDNLNENLDYDISGFVDNSVLGEYILTYTVTDSYGNISNEVTRTVYVVDTVKPVLKLLASIDTIFVGEEYIIPSISMTDFQSVDLDVVINGTVDTSVVGEYVIEYVVTDSSGNTSSISRYVNVVEKEEIKEFICEAGISTFSKTDTINPPDCYVDGLLTDVSINGDSKLLLSEGTHIITYSITINDVLYEKNSYIFIYNFDDVLINYYDFKRRYTL